MLPASIWPVVDLYFLTARFAGPLGGRVLPCPGAPAEQPAALLDAFAVLDEVMKDG
ncbi:hypothetical protein F4693_000164 [Sphingomonas endophytica]|uniref:Uncharacterized protein n=1 Tax=Sphingomonas endophytica TaxID=869719 RepID=A0A7X0J8X9_9SPHN|nr:hypothetical protein [Sphingomonas endophytica]MBB6503215.1 hypothetical protein [Sphingomonas endophytica]